MVEEITLKTVLDHMTAMEQRLSGRFDGVEKRLDGVDGRLAGLEGRVGNLDKGLSQVSWQIDAIDKRLDGIEIENLPKRIATLEAASER